MPEIKEMVCPIEGFVACLLEMNRNELAAHISQYHSDYDQDPEPYFEAERERRFK